MIKDIHVHLEDYDNILTNVEYLINRRYVCFKWNLSRKVDPVKSPYRDRPPSAIYSTKTETPKVSMTEKFHREKISFVDELYTKPYEAKKEVKSRWKK